MSLLQSRKDLCVFSGRFDLVVDYENGDYTDNGGNFFLRIGQKFLDRRATSYTSEARYYTSVATGAWYALISGARSIRSVWFSNAEREKWKLEKVSLDDLRADYASDPALETNGSPLIYTPATLRQSVDTDDITKIDQWGNTSYTSAVDHWTYDGLLWMPPASENLTLEVHGLFYQPTLVNDTDTNFWTEQEPQLLLMAACRGIEVSYRNKHGIADWEAAIDSELLGLEFDLVDQESAEITQMEG